MITRGELVTINRRLKQFNERFCPKCESTLPLKKAHWYIDRTGKVTSTCRKCHSMKQSTRDSQRRKQEPGYREQEQVWRRNYRSKPEKRELLLELGREAYRKRKARKLEQLHKQLGKAS